MTSVVEKIVKETHAATVKELAEQIKHAEETKYKTALETVAKIETNSNNNNNNNDNDDEKIPMEVGIAIVIGVILLFYSTFYFLHLYFGV
jgi:hypothetical protein